MKPSLMCYLLVIHIFLYEAQGIRLGKSIVLARNHQEIITESLSSNLDVESAMITEPSSGINRELMAKTISSSSTTRKYKNGSKTDLKFTHARVGRDETFPDVIDLTGMDYSPARRNPPIHNLIDKKS
ncbi:putative Root meristem growth factor 9 [Helianthus anomalus]